MAFRIRIDDKGTQGKASKRLQAMRDRMRKGLEIEMYRILTLVGAALIGNIRQQFRRRTGNMMNSVEPSKTVTPTRTGVTGSIGVQVPYAAIHEWGGTITAKKSKYLKFPAADNMRPDGSARVEDVQRPQFIPLKNGGWLIVERPEATGANQKGARARAAGMRGKAMFILKQSVDVPARPYIGPAHQRMEPIIVARFEKFVQATFSVKASE